MRSIAKWLPIVALLVSGCDRLLPNCTQIGCLNGLTIVLENPPSGTYTVEVAIAPGDVRRLECSANNPCGDRHDFWDVQAKEVTVRVISAQQTYTEVVRPDYTVRRPNGPDCPPACTQAEVQLALGA